MNQNACMYQYKQVQQDEGLRHGCEAEDAGYCQL